VSAPRRPDLDGGPPVGGPPGGGIPGGGIPGGGIPGGGLPGGGVPGGGLPGGGVPGGGFEIDPEVIAAGLDPELPVALLPVRLEVRFLPDRPGVEPTELVVRVFPDAFHVDAHDPALMAVEVQLGHRYWEEVWRGGGDAAATGEARRWLAADLGTTRAAYVARSTAPTNPGQAPAAAVPADVPLDPAPAWPIVAERTSPAPGRARLLPARWAAYVEFEGEQAGPFWAERPVAADLAVTPGLVDLPPGADARQFLEAQGMGWLTDIAAAVEAGMAIRIPLAALPDLPPQGYDRLVVLGVAAGDDHHTAMAELLEAHRATQGLGILPPGTPTNTTATAAGIGADHDDVDAYFDTELDPPRVIPPLRFLGEPAELFGLGAADAAAIAFGLAGWTALDRTRHAADPSADLARAANQALWPATLGGWFGGALSWADDGTSLLGPTGMLSTRDWVADFVRPEGPLPTLQVGNHPYGLLPVRTNLPIADPATTLESLEDVLAGIEDSLGGFEDAVPVLSPDATDRPPGSDEEAAARASAVGGALGAVPHLRRFVLRGVDEARADTADAFTHGLDVAEFLCQLVPDLDGQFWAPDQLSHSPYVQAFTEHEADCRGARGAQAQVDAIRSLADRIAGFNTTEHNAAAAGLVANYIMPGTSDASTDGPTADLWGLAVDHLSRVEQGQPHLARLGAEDHLGTERAPRLYTASYAGDGAEVAVGPLVDAARDDAAATRVGRWLDALLAAAGAVAAGGDGGYDASTAVPLLEHLLRVAVAQVQPAQAVAVRDGLARLRQHLDDAPGTALDDLDRLLRAALGPAMYRIDAWVTSLASQALATGRTGRRLGLQVGGYGWLVRVTPRAGRPSQGFVHAPSLPHATTAAVLRSGWSAFGTSGAGSPMAVDLSAPRVRAAKRIVEAMTAGLELTTLLGARLERHLHDRRRDAAIDEIRELVAAVPGASNRAGQVVDGLLVARAMGDGVPRTPAEEDLRLPLQALAGADAGVAAAIDDTVAELDAVADLVLAQSVHSLLRGESPAAAAALAATGSGDAGLPAIDLPVSGRGGRVLTTRALGFLPASGPGPWPGAPTSPAAAGSPQVEAWVAGLLGPPADVLAVAITTAADGTTTRAPTTLAGAGLGALDLVLAADPVAAVAAALGADTVVSPGRQQLAAGQRPLGDVLAVAGAVKAALAVLQPLRASHLAAPGEAPGDGWDLTELAARLAATLARVPAGDPRHDAVAGHEAAHPVDAGTTVARQGELLLDRVRLAAGPGVPVLPVVTAGVPAPLRAAWSAGPSPTEDERLWLARTGLVHGDLGTTAEALELAEAVVGTALLAPRLAVARPDRGAASTWCSITGPPPAGPVAGFQVASWTEVIPATTVPTGIAIHFDRPSAYAPNAILLATARTRFSMAYLHDCLAQTLHRLMIRGVGPDLLLSGGQFIPGVFLPPDSAVLGPVEES